MRGGGWAEVVNWVSTERGRKPEMCFFLLFQGLASGLCHLRCPNPCFLWRGCL